MASALSFGAGSPALVQGTVLGSRTVWGYWGGMGVASPGAGSFSGTRSPKFLSDIILLDTR